MAIFFMDGFDHYPNGDLYKVWTSKTGGDAYLTGNYKRTGSQCAFTSNGSLTKNIVQKSTIVVGCYFTLEQSQWGPTAANILGLMDNGTAQITIQRDSDGGFSVLRNGTLLGTSTEKNLFRHAAGVHLAIKVVFDNSVGSVEVRINNRTKLTLSNIDTVATANAYCNSVHLIGSYANGCYFDDVYFDDADFIGDAKIHTLLPNGAGATTSWDPSTGANYTCVDEAQNNGDTDYISTLTVDEIDTYTYDNLTPTEGIIYAVQQWLKGRKDDAGNRTVAPICRPVSTDRIGDNFDLYDAYLFKNQLMTVNPEDSAAWEIADVNGCEFGVKLIA